MKIFLCFLFFKNQFFYWQISYFFQQTSIGEFICVATFINISFVVFFLFFFIIISKLKNQPKGKYARTYIKGTRYELERSRIRKEKEKKVKILLARLVQKRAVHRESGGRERNLRNVCILSYVVPKKHTHIFYFTLFLCLF